MWALKVRINCKNWKKYIKEKEKLWEKKIKEKSKPEKGRREKMEKLKVSGESSKFSKSAALCME